MSERFFVKKDLVIVDRETNLMWQRRTSPDPLMWEDGAAYVERLNSEQFAGFSDWRYPAKEELATLLEQREDRETGQFIHPLFGKQRCYWTSTRGEHHQAVYADFYYGDLYWVQEKYANNYIRAVRSL